MEILFMALLLALALLFSKNLQRRQSDTSFLASFHENEFLRYLKQLRETGQFEDKILVWLEAIYRLETNHFKSTQFLKTFSAGMEKFGEPPYYGWNAKHFGNITPIGTVDMRENNTGVKKTFIVFKNFPDAMIVLANFLKHHGRAGRWFSTDEKKQREYEMKLLQVQTPIADSILT